MKVINLEHHSYRAIEEIEYRFLEGRVAAIVALSALAYLAATWLARDKEGEELLKGLTRAVISEPLVEACFAAAMEH